VRLREGVVEGQHDNLCDQGRDHGPLIENAVKFTVEGDSIAIDARRQDGDVVLSVSDSGQGIPEEDLQRVFEIFQTGSAAGDRAWNGLGLAIVGAIVEARNGTLEVTSTWFAARPLWLRVQRYVMATVLGALAARIVTERSRNLAVAR
jgi:light-regulated signal transduction histidine kinase (bacteriophytochrome)